VSLGASAPHRMGFAAHDGESDGIDEQTFQPGKSERTPSIMKAATSCQMT
jgi:hypothetical protein